MSINYDEGSFAAYGTTLLKLQREKDIVLYESKLPITTLNMLPRAVEQLLKPGLTKSWPQAQIDIVHGRYISLLFSIFLGLLIFAWSKKLYNEKTAFFVLLTYLSCPNFLSHGIFVSSDIFACFFMTASLFYLWLFFIERKFKYFVIMSFATGFAEISKFSMFHLFLLIPVLFAIQLLYQTRQNHVNGFGLKKLCTYTVLFVFINWFLICSSHLFYEMFVPLNSYTFKSEGFKTLQFFFNKALPKFPVPLPSSYIRSMDAVMYFDHLGGGVGGSLNGEPYILGKSSVHGFWYYYLVAIFFKAPIPLLLLWVVSLSFVFIRFSRKTFFQNDIFLLLPALYFLIYMNVFYSTQVGIRHLLIIFPLLFILSGRIISLLITGTKQYFLCFLVVFQCISVFRYFPHFLPYTNEFIIDKKFAYRKIADTNICYGEGTNFLRRYMAKHPDVVYMPEKPIAGKVILEVNEMLNLNIATVHKYDWANALVPIDHIHSQYLIFYLSKNLTDSILRKHRQL